MPPQCNWMNDSHARRKVGKKSQWLWSPRFNLNVINGFSTRVRKAGADARTRDRRTQRSHQDPRIRVVQALMMRYRNDKRNGEGKVLEARAMKLKNPERWKKCRPPKVTEQCWFIPSGWRTANRWLTGEVVCYHMHDDALKRKEEFVFVLTRAGVCHCVPTTQSWHRA